jgi:hypothetical protein
MHGTLDRRVADTAACMGLLAYIEHSESCIRAVYKKTVLQLELQ